MKITFNKKEIEFKQDLDRDLFGDVYNFINNNYQVKVLKKLEGFAIDQRYWNLEINDYKYTLNYEHYIGVTLSPSNFGFLNRHKEASLKLLSTIYMAFNNAWANS